MKLYKYKIEFNIHVDKLWYDDGLNAETLKRRIKEELPGQLCPYATYSEVEIKNIKVSKLYD